jgi:hypothetical protein
MRAIRLSRVKAPTAVPKAAFETRFEGSGK